MRKTVSLTLRLLVCLALMAAGPALAGAASGPNEALLQEIQEMKAKLADMDQLKAKVAELEEKLAASENKQKEAAEKTQTALQGLEAKSAKSNFKVGGEVTFDYRNASFDDVQKSKGGDGLFDYFALKVDGTKNDFLFSAQYRWYSYMNVIHHAWIGYDFTPQLQGQLGVTQVPIGLLPLASHNWWFAVPYYLGLEDDYDMGFKLKYDSGPLGLQLAFFKNGEWGDPAKLERYSIDVVTDGDQQNQETNTVNARLTYTLKPWANSSIELGFSGMAGQLYNSTTDSHGNRWAIGPHIDAKFGKFGVQLEALRYKFNPDNPEGVSDDTVLMGAFGSSFPVASEATVLVGNLSYDVPVKWGPITGLLFYNDFSMSRKEKSEWNDSYVNTLGCMISADPVYVYVDFIMSKNMLWLGGPDNALAKGDPEADWNTMFNLNVGYYF